LIGQCKFEGIYFVFFFHPQKERNPTHIWHIVKPHMPTLKPKLAKEPNFPSRIRPETKLYVSLTKLSKQISQMTKETFGEYIRRLREERNLPLRKVAAQLDVDTSTLSKIERGERPMSIDYLKPLSQILKIDYKELQVRFLADSINANYGKLEYLEDGLDEVINQIKKNKK
jgi:transcriptional regulator with XRE-family HTH domain